MNFLSICWRPLQRCLSPSDALDDQRDSYLWHKDVGHNGVGHFSVAVAQANEPLEDQSQIRVGPFGTFIGIYDGHGGCEASQFLRTCLFSKIETFAERLGGMSSRVLKEALKAAEEEFLTFAERNWHVIPQLASVGSCCLAGVIHGGNLYIANVGDSRVVLGTVKQGRVTAVRLSEEHNAGILEVRDELKALHPDDPQIVVLKHGVWRVKGIIQVSRSIGDLYLKRLVFNREPFHSRNGTPITLTKPVLSAEPAVHERFLVTEDQFLIFASDGLWEHITDQEACKFVQANPQTGIAKKLVKIALQQAAKKREMRYSDLRKIEPGVRRYFHDDMSVIVVHLNPKLGSGPVQRGLGSLTDRANVSIDVFSSNNL
ncbi:hypothetical protein KP509_06G064400 [Ceratopteris richardii]|uniref:protein-serine/threonine phosphatase n=2 Tax=Ceratopteris richardii TaxID=49495 RepID=A0A8T2UPW6_CERRI|nr:hypothetical protein KP509_06G064400 [Ceratopteris richardii]KAH7435425.1 hypothetical protein KP509_06G064400 [Ceratopteris richardii]